MTDNARGGPFPGYRKSEDHAFRDPPRPSRQIEDASLPSCFFPQPAMELFDPERHLADVPFRGAENRAGPCGAPPLPLCVAARANPKLALIPRVQDCHALWDKYAMLDNIRAHSALVADLAHSISLAARRDAPGIVPEAVLAAGLLHDLAKTYTIAYGGSHAQLGAAWVMDETRNPDIARAVLFHVHWPWEERLEDDRLFTVMVLEYADKRVRHDAYVSLEDRFEDLLERYGVNAFARERIGMSHRQGQRIEAALSRRLGVNLNEYIADNGRLVKRT